MGCLAFLFKQKELQMQRKIALAAGMVVMTVLAGCDEHPDKNKPKAGTQPVESMGQRDDMGTAPVNAGGTNTGDPASNTNTDIPGQTGGTAMDGAGTANNPDTGIVQGPGGTTESQDNSQTNTRP